MARNESERNNSSARNQTKRYDPLVAYGILVRSYKQKSKHKGGQRPTNLFHMPGTDTVRSLRKSFVHASDPGQQMSSFSGSSNGRRLANAVRFVTEGRDSAEKHTCHKNDKPEPNRSEIVMRQRLNFLSKSLSACR
jgi:hypothetical protein